MEAGKFYHIYNRGNNKENLFKEEENYAYFLKQYDKYLSNVVDTYAYCLMPNHFHFLVKVKDITEASNTFEVFKTSKVLVSETEVFETSKVLLETKAKLPPVIKGCKNFFTSYAKAINKKYDRTGSLFQYKFKRKEITSEEYLKNLIIYIHTNPINDGYIKQIEKWKHSSYLSIISDKPTKLNRKDIVELFENKLNFIHSHQDYEPSKVKIEG
jgi:REP-associated tyrosine transposase